MMRLLWFGRGAGQRPAGRDCRGGWRRWQPARQRWSEVVRECAGV